jgi:hypothetical protein
LIAKTAGEIALVAVAVHGGYCNSNRRRGAYPE